MAPSATTNGHTVPEVNGGTNVDNNGVSNGMYGTYKRAVKPDARITAMRLIKERLHKMAPLKAVLKLDLGLDEGPVYLDARGEPQLLDKFEGEPNCSVKMKPDLIEKFVEGKQEPRYALFKDGFFDETTLPTGDIKVAIKFGDYLGAVERTHPKPMTGEKLPSPTEDLEQVRSDIKKFGYGFVKNALSPEQVRILSEAIRQQGQGEVEAGVAKNDGGPQAPNQRIWTLINKGQEFHDLLEHPLIDDVIPDLLGDNFLIHSFSANIARPGNTPMVLHTDQVAIQPPIRDFYFGVNIMWFLTDINEENGGTRVFPGSHIGHIAPDDPYNIEGTVAAAGPAGTAMIFESRLWHATGANKMESGERPVILLFFMRSFVRQQENNFLSIRPEVEATMSDRVRKMLGFATAGGLGGIEGEVKEGHFVTRLANPVGPFRDSHKGTPYRQALKK